MTKLQRLFVVWFCPACLLSNAAQTVATNPLSSVKRIYVMDNFGKKADSSTLRKDLVNDLKKSGLFEVVDSSGQADAVLTGTAEVYVKSYFSLNPRAGVNPRSGEPIYGGSFSVELKDKTGETVWSYLSTSRSGTTDPSRDLAKDVVKHLVSGNQKADKK
jgi:hypothetical protein